MKSQNREEYDSSYMLGQEEIPCFSVKRMKKMYPKGNIPLAGETIGRTLTDDEKGKISEIRAVDGCESIEIAIEPLGSNSRLLFKKAGYVKLSDEELRYAVLLKDSYVLYIIAGILVAAIILNVIGAMLI